MVHNQIYKEKIPGQKAVQELKQKSGIEFDPELVDVFINKVLPEIDF